MKGNFAKWFYLLVLSLIWGSSFILIKKSLIGLNPVQVGSLRIFFTGLFLLIVGYKSLQGLTAKDWKWLIWSGLFGSFLPPFLFALAQTHIDSAVAAILNSLTPLNTLLMGVFLFGIKVSLRQKTGVFIGFLGTIMLILYGKEIGASQNYWYSLLIVASSLGYAFNINIIKTHLQHRSALSIATGNFVLFIIPAFVILLFTDFFSNVSSNAITQKSLLYVIILALFGTALAKVLFNKMLEVSSPVFAASVTYTMPLVAIFWGTLDGERLGYWQLIAGIIILLGVFMANRRG